MFSSNGAAFSQTLFLSGGMILSDAADYDNIESTQPAFQGGVRFWYTDLFQLQGGISYQGTVSAEAALQLRPFTSSQTLEPYAFAGFGRYFAGQDADASERSVLPVGVGAYYHLNNDVSLNLELGGRWTLLQDDEGNLDTVLGFMPTLGVSYNIPNLFPRREPGYEPEPPAGGPAVAAQPTTSPERRPPVRRTTTTARRDSVLETRGQMVLLPDGMFVMGLTDEDPLSLQTAGLKRVTVSKFYLDRYEVSNEEYRAFLDSYTGDRQAMLPDSTVWQRTGNRIGWTEYFRGEAFTNYPVVAVTYEQASRYCEAQGKRLPTEAEWEYAARAGRIGGVYPWEGLEPRDESGRYLANYNPGRGGYAADGYAFTAPVDAFQPSAWGLYNMSGNVAEWVQDTYNPSYTALSDFNPLYQDDEENRKVIRGGSWSSDAFYIGVGVRDAQPSGEASANIGFRCAMDYATDQNQQ